MRRGSRLPTVLLLAAAAGCGAGTTGEGGDGDPPHIVVLLVDDLGYGDVGFCGGDIATPRLDALAAESLVLERFYAAPMCSPSRAELMTGRSALALGMTRNVKPRDEDGLDPGLDTVADRLSDAGYATALVGKWHLGHGSPALLPGARGFGRTYGHLRGWIDYFTHSVDGIADWQRDGAPIEEEGYATDLIAREAVSVLETHDPARPLFLFVSFNAPHTPIQPPPGSQATDQREAYTEMVEHLDARIGDVLDALERRGLADDTVLWFLSDNGANPRYGGSNGELRGAKYTCHEGGVRVPACVRFPGRITPERTEAFLCTRDVAPTLLDLADATSLDRADGANAASVLLEGAPLPRRAFVFAVDHARVQRRAILSPPWKLIEERSDGGSTLSLHDVVADPLERTDVAAERPELVRELLDAAPWSRP